MNETTSASLILYSRPGCHLCERMLADFRINFGEDIEIDIIDVDSDPALRAVYSTLVPVLVGGEGELCRYRLDEQAVADYLERAAT